MSTTKIDWADRVWNPITGCSWASLACDHCYAKRMATRLAGRFGYPADEPFRVTLHEDRLDEPLGWRKPSRVFVVSMGDLFHEDAPDEYIARVFGIMAITCPDAMLEPDGRPVPIGPHHTFQVLTKRPERMRKLLTDPGFPNLVGSVSGIQPLMPMPHVWLGVTVEDQQRADERIPLLLQTPAAKRFVSCEPLLGPIKFGKVPGFNLSGQAGVDLLRNFWVIAGGESGPGARPTHPAWFEGLRDQCQAAGVPFFLKSWGEWAPEYYRDSQGPLLKINIDRKRECILHATEASSSGLHRDPVNMRRVGKKAAGHMLDGVEHREFPL